MSLFTKAGFAPFALVTIPIYLASKAFSAISYGVGQYSQNNTAYYFEKYNPHRLDEQYWKSDDRLPKNEDGTHKTFEQANQSTVPFLYFFSQTVVDTERQQKYNAIYKAMVGTQIDAFASKANTTSAENDKALNLSVETAGIHKEAFKKLLLDEYKASDLYKADIAERDTSPTLDYVNYKLSSAISSIAYNTSYFWDGLANKIDSLHTSIINPNETIVNKVIAPVATAITGIDMNKQYTPFLDQNILHTNPSISVFGTTHTSDGILAS